MRINTTEGSETLGEELCILDKFFLCKFSPSDLQECRSELANKLYAEEDSVDNLSHLWRYTSACLRAPLLPSAPQQLNVFIILFVASGNKGMENYLREDYLEHANSDAEFFRHYFEFLGFVFSDYQYGDPIKENNWLDSYISLRDAWLSRKLPDLTEFKSVCTITPKMSRKPPDRGSSKKGSGAKRRKKNEQEVVAS